MYVVDRIMPDIVTNNNSNVNATNAVQNEQSSSKHAQTIVIKNVHDQSNLVLFKHQKAHQNLKKEDKSTKSYESNLNSKSLVDYNDITPKYVSSKFAHPISKRDPKFYQSPPREKLQKLEENFNIDCVAVTFKRFPRGKNVYDPYNPLKDDHCQRYFKSPLVLDVLKKTMPSEAAKTAEIAAKMEDMDPIYSAVRSSNYHLLAPYPYSRSVSKMSRRSQMSKTGKSSTFTDNRASSIISSRNNDYYNPKMNSSGLKLPPIKSNKNGNVKIDKDNFIQSHDVLGDLNEVSTTEIKNQ